MKSIPNPSQTNSNIITTLLIWTSDHIKPSTLSNTSIQNTNCHICGKSGYWSKDCPNNRSSISSQTKTNVRQVIVNNNESQDEENIDEDNEAMIADYKLINDDSITIWKIKVSSLP